MKGCPECGSTNLSTTERILGDAGCTVEDDGTINHDGYTEVNWDSSETIGGGCSDCGWSHEDGTEMSWTDLLVAVRKKQPQ